MQILSSVFLFFLFISGCGGSKKPDKDPATVDEKLMNANKIYVKQESDEIDQYVKHKDWKMTTTGTGLRYMIYVNGTGEKATTGKYAKVNFKINLMDGTVCYTSEKTGPKSFLIGQDAVESGLHEGILLMKVGDKALFILPSHLAHGFTGDENKIPPKSSVVYDIELLELK